MNKKSSKPKTTINIPKTSSSTCCGYKFNSYPKLLKFSAIFLGIILIGGYFTKNLYTVATVDGQPIYRYPLIKKLEKQYGKQLLNQQITEMLILQKANKEGITIPQEQIDQEISKIEKQISEQGQTLDELLNQRGMNRSLLQKQIKIQKLVEAMQPQPTEPTKEEINTLLKSQADNFPKEMTEEDKKNAVKQQLTQKQNSQSINTWIQELHDSANIQYLIKY